MRFARLTPLALAVVPAAAFAAMSGDEVLAEAARLPRQVPGQYRTSLEMLEADGPAGAKDLAEVLRSAGNDEVENSEACADPEGADASGGTHLVREILEDGCTFDHFAVSGETVTAVAQCPPDRGLPERVKMTGRIGAERLDMLVTVDQGVPDKGTMRLKMRIRSERVGDCA